MERNEKFKMLCTEDVSYNSVEQDIDDPLLEQSLYQARGSMRCFVESSVYSAR